MVVDPDLADQRLFFGHRDHDLGHPGRRSGREGGARNHAGDVVEQQQAALDIGLAQWLGVDQIAHMGLHDLVAQPDLLGVGHLHRLDPALQHRDLDHPIGHPLRRQVGIAQQLAGRLV